MAESPGVVRQVAWRELFPWLVLFRTFRIAISPLLLALATAAVLVAPLGWRLGGRVFLPQAERDALVVVGSQMPRAMNSQLAASIPPTPRQYFPWTPTDSPWGWTALLEAYFDLAEPLKRLFQLNISLGEAAYYTFGFLWTLAIWAFPGGVVTRRAIVQLATEEPLSIRPAATYAGRRYHWYFLAPLYPLIVIVLLTIPIAVLGLAVRLLPSFGALLAGLSWLLVAIAGVGALWILAGLIFGWPLMWPTISAEREGDPFEAFSRSYSYVYGKPLRYFFYVVVAAAFGALCWAVVWAAMHLVREFGFWALSWGSGAAPAAELRQQALDFAAGEFIWSNDRRMWDFGALLIGIVVALIQAVATAFRFTFFFAVASAIYLLLRQDVDEKQMDEIYLEPEQAPAKPQPATAPVAVVTESPAPPP